jgi:hypothetical protein
MRLVCPSCGATASAEAWMNDSAVRYALEAIIQLPAPVLLQALPYLGLFRKGKNALPWKRAQVLIRSLRELVAVETVHVAGCETRPCNAAIWGAAMEATIDARPKGLKNHNYLRQVAWDKSAELAAKMENDREAARQRRGRDGNEEPTPLSETARQAIENLKKSWGEK